MPRETSWRRKNFFLSSFLWHQTRKYRPLCIGVVLQIDSRWSWYKKSTKSTISYSLEELPQTFHDDAHSPVILIFFKEVYESTMDVKRLMLVPVLVVPTLSLVELYSFYCSFQLILRGNNLLIVIFIVRFDIFLPGFEKST